MELVAESHSIKTERDPDKDELFLTNSKKTPYAHMFKENSKIAEKPRFQIYFS